MSASRRARCGWFRKRWLLVPLAALVIVVPARSARGGETPFREATAAIRGGDYPRGIDLLRGLEARGLQSPALYWNWAQAAAARGEVGEALWALLRARELAPGDSAIAAEIERLRQSAGLDPAELSPDPAQSVARFARRYHFGFVAVALLVISLLAHAGARLRPMLRWPVAASWACGILGVLLALGPLSALLARPTAVVVRRDAVLGDAAAANASTLTTLRRCEVVPVLGTSGGFVRVRDASGTVGWTRSADVWRLDRQAPGSTGGESAPVSALTEGAPPD